MNRCALANVIIIFYSLAHNFDLLIGANIKMNIEKSKH